MRGGARPLSCAQRHDIRPGRFRVRNARLLLNPIADALHLGMQVLQARGLQIVARRDALRHMVRQQFQLEQVDAAGREACGHKRPPKVVR